MQSTTRRRQTPKTLRQTAQDGQTLGARLRALRVRAGQSRAAAAAVTGIEAWSLVRYESDEREPTASTIVAICRAYKTSADRLLGLRKAG
jgi:transcriptional regulator with XRE-family HTH domain